jgi:hypothetical protein
VCALGFSASADASPARLTTVAREPVVATDQSSTREPGPARRADGSRADAGPNGRANAAFMAAFVLAGVAAVLVAASSRVSSG